MITNIEELSDANASVERLKELPSATEAERELEDRSPEELRAMVMVQLLSFKQRQLTHHDKNDPEGWDAYCRWSRLEVDDAS